MINMDRLEWLTIQIIVWTLSLLVVFFILYSIKFRSSKTILKIVGFLVDRKTRKNKIEHQKQFKARMYKRKSSEKTSALLFIFLLLAISFVVINQYVNFVVVTSGSMSPTIQKGDLVLVQSVSKIISTGDIIQFQTPSRRLSVLHRIEEVSTIGYKTKGDFNPTPDNWLVRDSQIQAKVITLFNIPVVIPKIGEIFIVDSKVTKYGSEFSFISGLVNIFRILALIIFTLAFLCLIENLFKGGNTS